MYHCYCCLHLYCQPRICRWSCPWFCTAGILLPGSQHGYDYGIRSRHQHPVACHMPDHHDRPAVYRRLLSFHSRIHQSRSYHRYDEADLARLHQKDPPKICCRCKTGRQLHVRFSGYRDYHIYFHLPGRVLHFRCRPLTAGARYGDHFYHDTGYAVQYGDRIRRNIIHHQFLLLPPTAEAVSQRTDDNWQAGAFHDPDPVHQELLGQSALSRTAPQILCRKLRRKSCIKLQKLHILTA